MSVASPKRHFPGDPHTHLWDKAFHDATSGLSLGRLALPGCLGQESPGPASWPLAGSTVSEVSPGEAAVGEETRKGNRRGEKSTPAASGACDGGAAWGAVGGGPGQPSRLASRLLSPGDPPAASRGLPRCGPSP